MPRPDMLTTKKERKERERKSGAKKGTKKERIRGTAESSRKDPPSRIQNS